MSNKILTLEIADNVLRYAYLERAGHQYSVTRANGITIDIDLSNPGVLYAALKNLLIDDGIKPDKTYLTISNGHIVLHQIVLPKMKGYELTEVITGEIEKIPLFHNTDFEHIYRCFPQQKGKQLAIVSAVPRNTLETVLGDIQRTKLDIEGFDVSPLNLKEIIQLTNPSISKDSEFSYTSEAFLVIHNHSMYFCIYTENDYKMFYKISNGLEDLTRADSHEAKESIINGWCSELSRVIRSYQIANKHTEVAQIRLIWDNTEYPNLDKVFKEKLHTPVKTFDLTAITNVQFNAELDINPIYVLALTPFIMDVHHLKAQFSCEQFLKNYQVKKYAIHNSALPAGFILLAGLFLSIASFGFTQKAKILEQKANRASEEYVTLQNETSSLFALQEEYETLREQLLAQASYIQSLNRISWAEVLSVFANELPRELALSKFYFKDSGKTEIAGDALAMEPIAELIRRIKQSSILENGQFNYLKEKEEKEKKYFSFGIYAQLKDETNEEN